MRSKLLPLAFSLAALLAACGGDPSNPADGGDAANDTGSPIDAPRSDANDATPSSDAVDVFDAATDIVLPADTTSVDATEQDSAPGEAGTTCNLPGAAPTLDGPNACSTLDFGQPEVPIATVSAPIEFTGGAIPEGIYDAVGYSRTTGTLDTTFRATLVVAADGRFTEVRVLSTGTGTPPTTRKSGMWHVEGTSFVRDVSCGGADAGFETNRLSYRVDCTSDAVLLHMGLTNLWFTYRRR